MITKINRDITKINRDIINKSNKKTYLQLCTQNSKAQQVASPDPPPV